MKYQKVIESPIGSIAISGDDIEITSIEFAGNFINSANNNSSDIIEKCAIELQEYFAGKRTDFSITLRQPGTEFQQKTWKTLESIPFGETISYLELAQSLGDKQLVRAVGNANGKNKIAIVIPCHRVIGANGNLVGYAGELWRKHWLLDHEKTIAGAGSQLSFL